MPISQANFASWTKRILAAFIALCMSLSFAGNAIAGAAASGLTVSQVWAGPGSFVRVYVKDGNTNAVLPTSCAKTNGFALLNDDLNFKEMYVIVMSALVASKTISIWIPNTADCAGNFVVANRVTIFK